MNRRLKIILSAVSLAVLAICIVLSVCLHKGYLILCGFVFCSVWGIILGIINKVQAVKEINQELKESALKDGEGPENVGELIQASFGFTKQGKENFKKAPVKDKLKVILMFVFFGVFLLTMVVGVIFASLGTLQDGTLTNFATIGFILMGIGGGGFVLEIVLLLVISKIKYR